MQMLHLAGNVGKDAVLRRTQGGEAVLNFSLAVDNGKDKEGNSRPATWFDCSIWGKRAESLEGHISKGTKLALAGRPTCRAHEGKAYLGITVDQLTFQGGNAKGDDRGERPPGSPSASQSGGSSGAAMAGIDDDSDIPFYPEVR